MANYPSNLHAVALYLRKSRADLEAENRGEGETLSKHRRTLYAFAAKYNYSILDVYEEIVSGERIIDRPEMQRLLHAVADGRYQAVLCMDIDRLGRGNMVDQGMIQDLFKHSQTLIITPRKVYDLQDEMDEEWSEFEAFMARRELKLITRRMQRGRRQSALEGKSVSRKPPYGYLRDRTLHLQPDPATAPIVQMIFALAAKGEGAQRISTHLTTLGIPSPSGQNHWDRSTIYSILQNPVYQGHIRWGHYQYQKTAQRKNGYSRKLAAEHTKVMKYDAHEPLVDPVTYALYKEKSKRHPSVPMRKTLSNPLAGLIVCARCGRTMMRKKTYHRPYNRLLCPTPGCSTRGTHFELVEQRILHTLQSTLSGIHFSADKEQHSLLIRQLSERTGQTRKFESLQATHLQIQKQLNTLYELVEQGMYDSTTFKTRRSLLLDRLAKLEQELCEATSEQAHSLETAATLQSSLATVHDPWVLYETHTSSELKNQLLKLFIAHITYRREQDWKPPDHFELIITLRL
ncbi:recombinase family protein [Sulfoacidibacillus thermotolerans]|uniref:Recombinase n=1 Tax=Sulfoacidibacillus thermotolerans TaxID=1765684 RepID=A0A2U3D9Y1_SULT2|nr:recombinase family protein [Sulfoacidibacillus thermotolerans]PWI58089.1 recombinase [Sulfoacidibacillus thermotolerans]